MRTVLCVGLALAACSRGREPDAIAPIADAPLASGQRSDIDPHATGSVRGLARFDGPRPERRELAIGAVAGCAQHSPVFSQAELVDPDGGVANVVVYVRRGLEHWNVPPPPSNSVELDQQSCTYSPHVVALRVGQRLVVKNSDPTTHNVHFFATRDGNPSQNDNQPPGAVQVETRFAKAEIGARVGCDLHPWMSAWISAFEHPFFAVTSDSGAFAIEGLPAGEYEFEAWHESFGRLRASARVASGAETKLDWTFHAR